MKKKALSLFLVTAMAVSKVGCGSKDADKNTDKNTDKKDTEVAATEKEAAAEDEAWEGDLTVWSPQEMCIRDRYRTDSNCTGDYLLCMG